MTARLPQCRWTPTTRSTWTDMLQHLREQCGGDAGVAGEVAQRDAEDIGAHVGEADDGCEEEADLVLELRVEEGTKAGEQGEEAGASGRRHEQDWHLKQSRVIAEKIQAGEGAFTCRGQRGTAGQRGESGGRRRDEMRKTCSFAGASFP